MKKFVFTAAVIAFAACTTTLSAQDEKDKVEKEKEKKQSQEIIIRKKGDKDTRITVEIKGDKVTINGKPLSEFKDDEITINKRNIIVRDGRGATRFKMAPEDFEGLTFFNGDHEGSGAFLGVTTKPIGDKEDSKDGAEVTNITKGSAAEKAGLQKGDVITKVNDKKVENPESLSDVIGSFKAKDEVTVYYNRGGKSETAKATLGERSRSMAYSFSGPDGNTRSFTIPDVQMWQDKVSGTPRAFVPGVGGDNYEFFGDGYFKRQKLGLKIQDTDDGKGVKVLEVDADSPADKAGLKKDDVVTEIGGKKVTNTDEVREQLHENADKASYNIKATRNGAAMNFDIKFPKKLKTANL